MKYKDRTELKATFIHFASGNRKRICEKNMEEEHQLPNQVQAIQIVGCIHPPLRDNSWTLLLETIKRCRRSRNFLRIAYWRHKTMTMTKNQIKNLVDRQESPLLNYSPIILSNLTNQLFEWNLLFASGIRRE